MRGKRRRFVGVLGGGALTAAYVLAPTGATVAATATQVLPKAIQAPEDQFTPTATAAGAIACQRPAPDNRVSTTIHCYTPNQIRAFYGLGPLTSSTTDGAGQTVVLVDSYGSPTAQNDV